MLLYDSKQLQFTVRQLTGVNDELTLQTAVTVKMLRAELMWLSDSVGDELLTA
jgi:hypothetical protein